MLAGDDLRAFLARLLGWSDERAVELALRSLALALDHRATLVLCGEGDMVPIALALHRRTLGAGAPFLVADPRRRKTPASVRSPANLESCIAAFEAARGGSLCVRAHRLPRDFPAVVAMVRDPSARVQLVVCCRTRDDGNPLVTLPAPIDVPPLRERAGELERIIDGYTLDAIAALGIRDGFTDRDRAWVLEHAAMSLSEIEKATSRLVAIRTSRNLSHAAARLGMAPVSLSRWIGRRKLPLVLTATPNARSVDADGP